MSQTNAYIPGLRATVGHGLPGRPQRQSSAAQGGGGSGGKLPLMLQFFPTKADVPPNYVALDGDHWDARLNAVDLDLSDKTLMASEGPGVAIAPSSNIGYGPGEFSLDGRFFLLNDSPTSSAPLKLKVLDMTDAGNVTVRAGVNPPEAANQVISSVTMNQNGMIVLTCAGSSGVLLIAYYFNEANSTFTQVTFPNLATEMGGTTGFNYVRFSPDGKYFALTSARGIGIYRLDGTSFVFVTKYGSTTWLQVEWLSSSELAVVEGTSVRRFLFDGSTLQLSTTWALPAGTSMVFSSDKKYYATVTGSGAVYVSLYQLNEGVATTLFLNKTVSGYKGQVVHILPGQEIVLLCQQSLSGGGFDDAYSVRLSIPSGATIAGPSLLDGFIPGQSYGAARSQWIGNSVALRGYNQLFLLKPPKPYLQNSAGMAAVKVS